MVNNKILHACQGDVINDTGAVIDVIFIETSNITTVVYAHGFVHVGIHKCVYVSMYIYTHIIDLNVQENRSEGTCPDLANAIMLYCSALHCATTHICKSVCMCTYVCNDTYVEI